MQPSSPLFSIITACRNAEGTIEKTLRSVDTQNFDAGDYEHVIIDGASSDETLGIVQQFPRVRCFSEPDDGIADAFNKGLRAARGEYILYLNADDYLHDDAVLSDTATFLDREDRPAWVVGDIEVTVQNGLPTLWSPKLPVSCLSMMFYCRVPHQAVFLRRETLQEMDGFSRRFTIGMDYDLWQRMCERGYKPVLMRRRVSIFSMDGVSSKRTPTQMDEHREIVRRFRDNFPKRVLGAAYDLIKGRY